MEGNAIAILKPHTLHSASLFLAPYSYSPLRSLFTIGMRTISQYTAVKTILCVKLLLFYLFICLFFVKALVECFESGLYNDYLRQKQKQNRTSK